MLTLSLKAQLAAAAALDGRRGSVVVLDMTTGGVVAMYSNPTFDPQSARDAQREERGRPCYEFLQRGARSTAARTRWREIYPPGSTFKTITAATALADGIDITKTFPT